jgi:hypothetical protein
VPRACFISRLEGGKESIASEEGFLGSAFEKNSSIITPPLDLDSEAKMGHIGDGNNVRKIQVNQMRWNP